MVPVVGILEAPPPRNSELHISGARKKIIDYSPEVKTGKQENRMADTHK